MNAISAGSDIPGDLRDRRRRTTTAEISEAALTLFEKKGVALTTVHDIASAAGVSDRTCFRYFPSKEEAVLTLHLEFEGPITAWLSAVATQEPPLPQLEAVYAAVLEQLDGPLAHVAHHQLRVRRLMFHEPQLRAASFSLDAAGSWIMAQRLQAAYGDALTFADARLVTELAGVGVRAAFDQWADLVGQGQKASLADTYARVRDRMRVITATNEG